MEWMRILFSLSFSSFRVVCCMLRQKRYIACWSTKCCEKNIKIKSNAQTWSCYLSFSFFLIPAASIHLDSLIISRKDDYCAIIIIAALSSAGETGGWIARFCRLLSSSPFSQVTSFCALHSPSLMEVRTECSGLFPSATITLWLSLSILSASSSGLEERHGTR